MTENSYYEPKIEQGYYITEDGMIVTWWDGVLLQYPDFGVAVEPLIEEKE